MNDFKKIVGDSTGREAALKIYDALIKSGKYSYNGYGNNTLHAMPPRCGKTAMTDQRRIVRNQFPFNLPERRYLTELTMFDRTLKDNCDAPKEQLKQLEKELVNKAEDSLLEYFKLESPGIPDEVIRAFIRVYVGFEITVTREPETLSSVAVVTPEWKPIDLIDFGYDITPITDYLVKNSFEEVKK